MVVFCFVLFTLAFLKNVGGLSCIMSHNLGLSDLIQAKYFGARTYHKGDAACLLWHVIMLGDMPCLFIPLVMKLNWIT